MKTRMIAVANQKGGVGKTTTVINLSVCLAELGHKVLLIDIDPQCNATSGIGITPASGMSLYQPLLGNGTALSLIQETSTPGLNIIASELDLAGSEVDIARSEGYLHCFRNAVTPVIGENKYDFIFVDCPPSLGILTMNALAAADSLIVPMQCEYYALEGLSVIVRLIEKLHQSGANPRIELEGILMTMFDGRTNLAADVVKEVWRHFGNKVYDTIIPRNVRISEAPSYGQAIIQYDPSSSGAKAYKHFAKEFIKRSHTGAPGPETAPKEQTDTPQPNTAHTETQNV